MTQIQSSFCKKFYFYSSLPDLQSNHVIPFLQDISLGSKCSIFPSESKVTHASWVTLPISEHCSSHYREVTHTEGNMPSSLFREIIII